MIICAGAHCRWSSNQLGKPTPQNRFDGWNYHFTSAALERSLSEIYDADAAMATMML